jgi:hypothetical protein
VVEPPDTKDCKSIIPSSCSSTTRNGSEEAWLELSRIGMTSKLSLVTAWHIQKNSRLYKTFKASQSIQNLSTSNIQQHQMNHITQQGKPSRGSEIDLHLKLQG